MATENTKAEDVSPSRSTLTILFSVVFLDNLGFAIVVPYLFFIVQAMAMDGSTFIYGVLLASYSLMSFVFTPIVARLSDSYGRRKILIVALAVSSFSYFVFGTANALWLVFAARMIAGTTAATVPVAQAYVADITTPKDRLRYLGLLGAAAGIAFVVGPAIGGTLSDLFGYAVPSFLAGILAFVNLVSAYFRLPEPSTSRVPTKSVGPFMTLRNVLRTGRIGVLLSVYFLFFLAFVFLQASLSPWLQAVFGFGELEVGLVFFFLGGISVFTQAVLLPKLSKKYSDSYLALVGVCVLALGLFALAAVQNLVVLIIVAAAISFGFGLLIVTLNTLISVNSTEEAQGGTLGVAWALAALAQTIAPVLAASAFGLGLTIGFTGLAFVVSALIVVATLPLLCRLGRVITK